MDTFRLNGKIIEFDEVMKDHLQLNDFTEFEVNSLTFIKDWITGKNDFSIKTSGSTGRPKTVVFSRSQLKRSAQRTLETFGLKEGDRVLVCLNPNFVAGKMMLVRGLEGDLKMNIVNPELNQLSGFEKKDKFDFTAFFPNQVEKILRKTPEIIENIKTILVGGAELHPNLEHDLQRVKSQIFHSYATTETLSHQAIRKVNGTYKSDTFYAIKNVSFAIDERSCLVINDQLLGLKNVVTNDIVELLDPSSFRWKGRLDNVVNSGGIKIQIEENEQLIRKLLIEQGIYKDFCLVAKADPALSQKMVLIIKMQKKEMQRSHILKMLTEQLPKYHAPKEIIFVPKLYFTKTGKIDRLKNTKVYIDMQSKHQ